MSSKKLMEALELKHRPHFRNYYLIPALEQEFIEMSIPERPKSSKQRYRLTEKGKALKAEIEQRNNKN
jgi:hypothetical protein